MPARITVEPWPLYAEHGGAPSWNVKVEGSERSFAVVWSSRLGRFTKSWNSMHMRRSDPQAHQDAAHFMAGFCSKNEQTVTLNPQEQA